MDQGEPEPDRARRVHVLPLGACGLVVVDEFRLLPGLPHPVGNRLAAAVDEDRVDPHGLEKHDVPQETLDLQLAWAQRFFALPMAAKRTLSMEHGHGPVGYEPMQLQTLDLGSPPDLKEGFQFHRERDEDEKSGATDAEYRGTNRWPRELSGFRAQMLDYHERVIALGTHLMRVIAQSLELPGRNSAQSERH